MNRQTTLEKFLADPELWHAEDDPGALMAATLLPPDAALSAALKDSVAPPTEGGDISMLLTPCLEAPPSSGSIYSSASWTTSSSSAPTVDIVWKKK